MGSCLFLAPRGDMLLEFADDKFVEEEGVAVIGWLILLLLLLLLVQRLLERRNAALNALLGLG